MGIGPGKSTRNGFYIAHSVAFRAVFCLLGILVNQCLPIRGGNGLHQLMFRRQHQKGGAVYGINAGGKYFYFFSMALYLKIQFCPLRAAYPVALHFLYGFGPLQPFQISEQAAGIGGNAQAPLLHFFADHRKAPPLRYAILHLFIGQHGAQGRAPVYGGIRQVGQAVVQQYLLPLGLRHGLPGIG
ncbi:hypothetical protein ADICEAN_04135 [Cesiribacter andamanensis AMV16]|uniref:Uncharacterized protein n=1 Tax=Cesiribacter andamanensis AMV16 TaxID=1279009 RepID=M7NQH0_9BACT|nr:hypothetical protein ADICEAN_04135 [Cesiribacter andamanensis AMV16]